MFAKKLLSLVALLFVGSQISTVSAAIDENTPGYYLVDGSYKSVNTEKTQGDATPDDSVSSATDCGNNVGKLIKYSGNVYLCLTADYYIKEEEED